MLSDIVAYSIRCVRFVRGLSFRTITAITSESMCGGGRKRREMLSSSEQLPDKAFSKSAALEPVSQRWTRRDTMLITGLWALTAVALTLLSIAAHFSAEFPGDEGLAVLIQKITFPPLAHFIEFSSDANWPAPAA